MLNFSQFKKIYENKNKNLIFEGLIYSFSYSKFIEKLKNILSKNKIHYSPIYLKKKTE